MTDMNSFYELTGIVEHNVSVIKIIKGEFEGVEYTYGSVAVEEDHEKKSASLNFQYTIIAGDVGSRTEAWRLLIGDILLSMLDDQIKDESVIYKGTGNLT